MSILDGNKKKTIEHGIFTFHKGAIECKGEERSGNNKILKKKEIISHFIQTSQVARVWKADLPMEEWLLALAVVLCIVGLLSITRIWYLGLLLLAAGVACGYVYFNKRRYMLLIETSSGGLYSFVSPEESYIRKGYDIILEIINKREDERTPVIYNIATGQVTNLAVGDYAKAGEVK